MNSPLRVFKAQIFQALAHPTRIAVAEVLGEGERTAGALQLRLGVEQANLSQHLAVLRKARVVVTRRAGNQVFYSLRDPVLRKVLHLLRSYFFSQLDETRSLLVELKTERRRRA